MNTIGYSPKDLHFDAKARRKLVVGIQAIARAVKSTLGPAGNTVLIESPDHTHGITVTKDGVTVAKQVRLMDPVENLAVRIMLQAAERASSVAGDGTTTAIVLAEALVMTGFSYDDKKLNKTELLRKLVELSDKVIEKLKEMAVPVTDEMVTDVASISANNDMVVGNIISDTYKNVGKDGYVTVENSKTSETYAEVSDGVKIKRGFASDMFINNHKRDESILEDAYVLVADVEISNLLHLEHVIAPIVKTNKKLLIIAPCSHNVTQTIAANVKRGVIKACIVPPPNFGYKQHELMQDIALSVGAKYFSEGTGDDLSIITFDDLGHASRVVADREKTMIIKSSLKSNPEEIKERIEQLREAASEETDKIKKEFINERIATLSGGVGVIYVGGNTDLEQKELYDRVDDSVCAVRSALEEGILPGGGKALANINIEELVSIDPSPEEKAAAEILYAALQSPMDQILNNAGICTTNVYNGSEEKGFGYNVKTGEKGDLIKMGVIDPLKVTRSALQNAVSVACTILSTNAVITMARSYETENQD